MSRRQPARTPRNTGSAKGAKLFYAWEFGAGLGHIGPFLPLARALRERGHQVHWAITQTGPGAQVLDTEGFTWLQAPNLPERVRPGPPLNYADILLRYGYWNQNDLLGLVVAWRELMRLTGTQLVLADHAPTAVLAARSLGLPVMLFSNGFTVPPRLHPLPALRPWQPVPEEQLLALEKEALDTVNAIQAHFDQPSFSALWQIFDVAEEALLTYPELDHYECRGDAYYWGCLPNAAIGVPPPWPPQTGPRLFAYLRPEMPHAEAVLSALHSLGLPTVIYFPGLSTAARQRFDAPHLAFADSPVDLHRAAAEADVAITYSSLATATGFLLAGKPLLLLPFHLEQFLLARRIADLGAALLVNPEQTVGDLGPAILTLLNEPGHAAQARAFATRYAAFSQEQVAHNLVRRIESLVTGSPAHEQ